MRPNRLRDLARPLAGRLEGDAARTDDEARAGAPDVLLEGLATAHALRWGLLLAALEATRAHRRAEAEGASAGPRRPERGHGGRPPLMRMRTYEELRERISRPPADPTDRGGADGAAPEGAAPASTVPGRGGGAAGAGNGGDPA